LTFDEITCRTATYAENLFAITDQNAGYDGLKWNWPILFSGVIWKMFLRDFWRTILRGHARYQRGNRNPRPAGTLAFRL
jgi:hypothetical protein